MAHMATDGKKFTNRPPMMAHNRSLEQSQPVDATAQPGGMEQQGEMDANDPPSMTHHNPGGTHTTVHESGMEHDHANLEALKQHLDQFFTEEEQEPQEQGGEPEYE